MVREGKLPLDKSPKCKCKVNNCHDNTSKGTNKECLTEATHPAALHVVGGHQPGDEGREEHVGEEAHRGHDASCVLGHNHVLHGKGRQGKARQGKARQGKARQGKAK